MVSAFRNTAFSLGAAALAASVMGLTGGTAHAQQPAPHMVPPPFLHNTGQKGEFVLPLNIPAGPGQQSSEKYDDFTFDAAAWTLTEPSRMAPQLMSMSSVMRS